MVPESKSAWLVGAAYKDGFVTLRLITLPGLEPIQWVDSNFHPYYLTTENEGDLVRKRDLFTGNELTLHKVTYAEKPAKNTKGRELDTDPSLSYAYDKLARLGMVGGDVS